MGERERFELSQPYGFGTLAVCWAPHSPFPLRGPDRCRWWPRNRTATSSFGGSCDLRFTRRLVTSRGIEPRSLGLQPSAMTTLARWSEWRLAVGPGLEPRSCPLTTGRVAFDTTLQARMKWLADVDSNHDWRRQRPLSCRWTICQWSGREDSNLHTPAPEAGGLPLPYDPEMLG
jgi:hypothetical protein